MKVINLFGGPGISKSTTATGIFHKLKLRGVNCEYVSEYAKSLVWRNRPEDLADQLYITAKQNRSLDCLRGKVDFAISDSPLLLGIHYAPSSYLRGYDEMVLDLFNSYKNTNFLLTRVKKYNPAGRVQTEEQAKEIDGKIQELLDTRGIPYTIITGDEHASDTIVRRILHENY